VTVAAVFGYAVLSAGIFSSEKGKETVYAGLEQAKSSMEVKGSVIVYGAPGDEGLINDCEDAWTTTTIGVDVTVTMGFGSGHSNQFTLDNGPTDTGFPGGLVASASSEIQDLSQKTFINLYVRTDTNITATDLDTLQLALVPEGGGEPIETLDLPEITKDTWTLVTLDINSSLYSDENIQTVELRYLKSLVDEPNPVIIWVDNVVSGPPYTHADLVVFTVANAVAGKPIDLTPTPDNKTVIAYTDSRVYQPNVEWSVSFVGSSDGDYLLEQGEQAQITVPLGFLSTPPTANEAFGLQVKPPHGSVINRSAPGASLPSFPGAHQYLGVRHGFRAEDKAARRRSKGAEGRDQNGAARYTGALPQPSEPFRAAHAAGRREPAVRERNTRDP